MQLHTAINRLLRTIEFQLGYAILYNFLTILAYNLRCINTAFLSSHFSGKQLFAPILLLIDLQKSNGIIEYTVS